MKNEGLTFQIWVITPKNEGYGFPWYLSMVFFGPACGDVSRLDHDPREANSLFSRGLRRFF